MKKFIIGVLFSALLLNACAPIAPLETQAEQPPLEEGSADVETDAASNFMDFDPLAYEAALAEGKTIFLDFHANWCPTCRSNAPKIESVFKKLTDDSVVGFRVNYDTETALKREFGVTLQSTLILIRPDGSTSQLGPALVTEDEVSAFLAS